jgi:hypothetical protein
MRLSVLTPIAVTVMAAVPALATAPARAADARSMSGVWEGGYDCWHGKTFLRLTLTGEANGDLTGTWRFGQVSYDGVAQQPIPDGEYRVHGWLQDDGGVHLSADGWILKPEGDWMMVGLMGDVGEKDGDHYIAGYVLSATCGRFAVFKK